VTTLQTTFAKQLLKRRTSQGGAQPAAFDPEASLQPAEKQPQTTVKARHQGRPLKIVVVTSVFLIIAGLLVSIGAVVVFPFLTATLDDVQVRVSNSLTQVSAALSDAQEIVGDAQGTVADASDAVGQASPALERGAGLAEDIAEAAEGIGPTISGMADTLSGIGIEALDWYPFEGLADMLRSIQTPIENASSDIREISNSITNITQRVTNLPQDLENLNTQLSALRVRLDEIKRTIEETNDVIPGYFNQAKTALLAATAGVAGFGVLLILSGISVRSLRKAIMKTNKKLEELQATKQV
jgi:predicted PurR-regulated permease PerM